MNISVTGTIEIFSFHHIYHMDILGEIYIDQVNSQYIYISCLPKNTTDSVMGPFFIMSK